MKNKVRKRILWVLGTLAVLDGLAVGAFFNMAAKRDSVFFRKKEKKKGEQGKTEKDLWEEQVQRKRSEGTQWIQGMNCQRVQLRSRDGLLLAGYYLEAEDAGRIVVMFHGWRGSWKHDFGACLRWMYEEGASLLLIEQRAQGESEGKYMGFGVLERWDCHAWLRWLEEKNERRLPVYLYGVSMGAATVLMAAGDELPGEVKGVIADCGFTSPYEMVYRFGHTNFKLPKHPLMDELNWVFKRRAGYGLKEYSTLKAMEHCRVPVLLIHGTADTFVPYEMSVQNYEACTAEKKLLLVEGAEHCESYLKDRKRYQNAVSEFLQDTAEGGKEKGELAGRKDRYRDDR